jgi:radical SAM superfamily enzyme YgiQ (UPF0313 family)
MPHQPRVWLVNPSNTTFGYSFITPRWLFVLAAATPEDIVGDPLLVDEAVARVPVDAVRPGDIVGIGINSGNCLPGYRLLRSLKQRGATVVFGGIHTTLFPDEPLQFGADAVVTGNGDVIWRQVVVDALRGNLQRKYSGGRVAAEAMAKARWDLLDPRRYVMASVQTVAGCPENCSFCSVWVTEGRRPRMRPADRVIGEVQELCRLGFRTIVFADDNFAPSTQARIAREPSAHKRREFEQNRRDRLAFFEEFSRSVPPSFVAVTQLTAEIASDEEYLSAVHDKMRVRVALVGVESFSQQGLASANKQWNPVGKEMIRAIHTMQDRGVLILSSIICGLESDTPETLQTMRSFAVESGAVLTQFTIYSPYPGTVDFHEMVKDRTRIASGQPPVRAVRLLDEKFWLSGRDPVWAIAHPHLTSDELLAQSRQSFRQFYSIREIARRMRFGVGRHWNATGKVTYALASLAFARIYGIRGVSADSVRARSSGIATRLLVKIGIVLFGLARGGSGWTPGRLRATVPARLRG